MPRQLVTMAAGAGLVAVLGMLLSGKHSDISEGSAKSNDFIVAVSFVVASCLIFVLIGLTTRETPLPQKNHVRLGSPEYDLIGT